MRAKIVDSNERQWAQKYIAKEIIVKPFLNYEGEVIDWLYTVVRCKHNKWILDEIEWGNVKYKNTWGYTLSIRAENVVTID